MQEFFPTPPKAASILTQDLHMINKKILEPQSGKGDLISHCTNLGADVLCCEINPDLAKISATKGNFLKHDFFNVVKEEVSHIDYCIMNPPFSNADKHILHAWEVCPDGAVIRSLMNRKTYTNQYSRGREQLGVLIKEHGRILGTDTWFVEGERFTVVDAICIEIVKPKKESDDPWEGYFETEDSDTGSGAYGIMPHDEIRSLVQRVVTAADIYDKAADLAVQMNKVVGSLRPAKEYKEPEIAFMMTESEVSTNRDTFIKQLQKGAWHHVFRVMDLERYFTSKVQGKINEFIEMQEKVPFTMKNIKEVLSIVVGTSANMMNETFVDVFDRLTLYHKENRYALEGWKTNSHYMVNEKVIFPFVVRCEYGYYEVEYKSQNAETINDLYKVLCYMEGKEYDAANNLDRWFTRTRKTKEDLLSDPEFVEQQYRRYDYYTRENGKSVHVTKAQFLQNAAEREAGKKIISKERNTWYDWTFFKLKFFKKGTIHLQWKDRDMWARFNRRIAEIKGFELPSNF